VCGRFVHAAAPVVAQGDGSSPSAARPAGAESVSRLEELVGTLASLQGHRAEASEQRRGAAGDSVLILDDVTSRSSLQSSCLCDDYIGSASASSSVLCGKQLSGRTVCSAGSPACPSDAVSCSIVLPGAPVARALQASPTPSVSTTSTLLDAETTSRVVNIQFEASARSALPSEEAVAKQIATAVDEPVKRVSVQMMKHASATLQEHAATVRATVTPHDVEKAQDTLSHMHSLQVKGSTITVGQLEVTASEDALVCDSSTEALKRETFGLFSQFLDLKAAELDLLAGLTDRATSSDTKCHSCTPVQLFASQLGISR